jgi:hypothetical protein
MIQLNPTLKRITFLILFMILVMGFNSCAKEPNRNCSLSKVYLSGKLYRQFFFNQSKLAKIEEYNDVNNQLLRSWKIYYDEFGRLDYVDYLNEVGTLVERTTFTRNADGNIGRAYYWNDTNNDMFPETMFFYHEFVYNESQQIIEDRYYSAPSTYVYSEFWTWDNNNIIKKGNLNLGYYVYSYDDKKSMNASHRELFTIFYDPTFLSNNNATEIRFFDSFDNLVSTTLYSFIYNVDGYPESASSPYQYQYEYNCVTE